MFPVAISDCVISYCYWFLVSPAKKQTKQITRTKAVFISLYGWPKTLSVWTKFDEMTLGVISFIEVRSIDNTEFKIRRLRTTTMVKHATAHDQNHVTVHFSHIVLRLRWVVELFRVVGTTKNILLVFCSLGNSRISSFRKNVFNIHLL